MRSVTADRTLHLEVALFQRINKLVHETMAQALVLSQLTNQRFHIEEQYMAFLILRICPQSLNKQWIAPTSDTRIDDIHSLLCQMCGNVMESSRGRRLDGRQIPMSQSSKQMQRRIDKPIAGRGNGCSITSGQNLFSGHTMEHSIKVARLHLPDVDRSIDAANNHKVIQWTPLDGRDWEEVTGGEHDAFAFFKRD